MNLEPTEIEGVVVVGLTPHEDERGSFARAYDRALFAEAGLLAAVVDVNVSTNKCRGTLRGMHYQDDPEPDPKIVRCVRGAIYDVAVDLRPDSKTFRRWTGHRLDADGRRALHIPASCAHGFLTLEDDTEVHYLMGAPYRPELSRGVRWNDPAFGIVWPAQPVVLSDRDAAYPDHDR